MIPNRIGDKIMKNQKQQSAPDATNSPAASELIRSTGSRHVCPGCGCDDTEEIEGAWNDWCNNCETHFYFENIEESNAAHK